MRPLPLRSADDAPSYGYAAPPEGMGMGGSEGGSQVSGGTRTAAAGRPS
jgi:hypothetical protein